VASASTDRRATTIAVAAAAVTIAFQLAGKATRDALFLSTFSIAALPRMLIAAALVSAALTVLLTRLMARTGPGRLMPPLFALSGALLLGEWWLTGMAPAAAAVLVYLHFAGLGALLVSGFWALVNERFDPRTARGAIRRVTTGASLGALLGGILSERIGASLDVAAMLPVLASLHFVAAWLATRLRLPRGSTASPAAAHHSEGDRTAPEILAASPYLRGLALLVILTAAAEGLLDYVFKAGATGAVPDGPTLLRLFAAFYTGTAVLSIVVQLLLLRPLLSRLGIARSAALLPAGVTVGAAGCVVFPGLGSVIAVRAVEVVLRSSAFRAAYEMLFTPVTPREKRATKLLLDVGAARVGDITGGLLVQAALVTGLAAAAPLLGATILLSLGALLVARRLHLGYVGALERNLQERAGDLARSADLDAQSVLHTFGAFDLSALRATPSDDSAARPAVPPLPATPGPAPADPGAHRLAALASLDAARVRAALAEGPITPELVESVIGLVAWDEVAPVAIAALHSVAREETNRLVAHLLDPDEDFAVRRRIVLVLAGVPSREAFEGLVQALGDRRFEVRYRAGRALSRLAVEMPDLAVERERIIAAILREVAVGRSVWESRRLIDQSDDDGSPMEWDLVRDRATRSLEHVFSLLSLILPRETLRLAFQGLHTGDRHLRGTALEYLETVLPEPVREKLWPFLEVHGRPAESGRSPERVVQDLLASRESIVLALAEVRGRRSGPAGDRK